MDAVSVRSSGPLKIVAKGMQMSLDYIKIRRALLSVSDKTGLIELATALDKKELSYFPLVGQQKLFEMQVCLCGMFPILLDFLR